MALDDGADDGEGSAGTALRQLGNACQLRQDLHLQPYVRASEDVESCFETRFGHSQASRKCRRWCRKCQAKWLSGQEEQEYT